MSKRAGTAILRAEVLSRIRGNVGAVAFSRTGDPDVGVFEDAVVLKQAQQAKKGNVSIMGPGAGPIALA
jgi:hypothetical protein